MKTKTFYIAQIKRHVLWLDDESWFSKTKKGAIKKAKKSDWNESDIKRIIKVTLLEVAKW